MSVSLGQHSAVAAKSNSSAEVITAALANKQQEAEGQMALQLIQSASISNVPAPTGNLGSQVNIKV